MNRWLAQIGVGVAAVVVAFLLTQKLPFLAMVENWVADYRIASLSPPRPAHPDIVVVSITEDTLGMSRAVLKFGRQTLSVEQAMPPRPAVQDRG